MEMTTRNLIILICAWLVILFFVVDNNLKSPSFYKLKSILVRDVLPHLNFPNDSKTENTTRLLFDHCSFRKLDPWDPLLAKALNSNYDPNKDCVVKYKQLTQIENNSVILLPKLQKYDCRYTCLLTTDDLTLDVANWTLLENGTKPECDVILIECFYNSTLKYQFMHTLIHRNESSLTPPDSPDMPSVHIIILDSVSSSQLQRSMIRTSTFLRDELQAQQMTHLNKIGLNSRPNGYALLFGKQKNTIAKSRFSRGHPSDFPRDPCGDWLDDDQFIGFRYKDAGYVTYMAEDWAYGVFNWPDCVGFKTKPMDHYMRPFQLYFERKSAKAQNVSDSITHKICKEPDIYLFDYFQQFLDTYQDRPTFSINWMSLLAHDSINGLYHIDDYFYRFFQKNAKLFNDSYVIFMGDHGNRFHKARDTWVGEVEDNNPMLWISVPRNKRTPKVLKQLEENSKKLITHYDVYATLNSLVEPMKPRNASEDVLLHGENLFGPLREPRTCDRLRIPFEFCSCDFGKTKLPKDDETAVKIANKCIRRMNKVLQSRNETISKCAHLSLNLESNVTAATFTEKGDQTVYQVSWVTTPGDGQFSAFAIEEANGDLNIVSQKFPRSNAYADQAKCVKHANLASYCYCKYLLSNTTTTTPASTPNPLRSTTTMPTLRKRRRRQRYRQRSHNI